MSGQVFLEKSDVFIFELDGLLGLVVHALYRVFPNTQEIVESNERKVSDCPF
jgi:hypothetical protein